MPTTIAETLTAIQTWRNKIRSKLVSLGLAQSTDKLEALADSIDGIVDQGAVSATVKEGDTYTIPKGYHNGSGTVSGVSGGGNYNLQSKTVTPTKSQQNVTPDDGYFGLSDVTVTAIPEMYKDVSVVTASASDVLSGKIFVSKGGATTAGTMPNYGAASLPFNPLSDSSINISQGYYGSGAKVSLTDDLLNALLEI